MFTNQRNFNGGSQMLIGRNAITKTVDYKNRKNNNAVALNNSADHPNPNSDSPRKL